MTGDEKKNYNRKYNHKYKAYPLRLGDLWPLIQQDTVDMDKSGQYIIRKIIREYYVREGRIDIGVDNKVTIKQQQEEKIVVAFNLKPRQFNKGGGNSQGSKS